MKKKMNIKNLKVDSFVTDLSSDVVVKGGCVNTLYGHNGCSLYIFPCIV